MLGPLSSPTICGSLASLSSRRYMPVFSYFPSSDLVRFLWNWWIRRKRLNENYALGMHTGISLWEFRRLIFTVTTIIILYLPLSIYGLFVIVRVPLRPFVWELVRGPLWKIIVFEERDKAPWNTWIGVILAFQSFVLIAMMRNAIRFYQRCAVWTHDQAPKSVQKLLPFMQRISEDCKKKTQAELTLANSVPTGGRRS